MFERYTVYMKGGEFMMLPFFALVALTVIFAGLYKSVYLDQE